VGPAAESLIEGEVEDLQRDLQIALALLNHPGESVTFIVGLLREEGYRVTLKDIASFLVRYDIKKKDNRPEVSQLEIVRAAARVQGELRDRRIPLAACLIVLDPPITQCPRCMTPLYAVKTTKPRRIVSIRSGEFWLKERVKACGVCGEPMLWRSEVPRLLVPPKRVFAYDVMVFVGEQKFLFSKTLEAIRKTLAEDHRVSISPSLLSLYAQEFCYRFECLHYAKLAKLGRWIKKEQLGYMLHVDCSCEHKSDTIFVAYDRTSEIALVSEKIPSERLPFLVPVLRKIKKYLGNPVSTMSDLALPFIKAIEKVFPGAQQRICHFHFLRDVGKDLLNPCYGELRTALNQSKISAELNALERDILSEYSVPDPSSINGEEPLLRRLSRRQYAEVEPAVVLHFIRSCRKVKSTTGFGYPFDLPWVRYSETLYRQAIDVHDCVAALRKRRFRSPLLDRLAETLSPFLAGGSMYEKIDPTVRRCLIREIQVTELRKVMRLCAPRHGRAPLSAVYGVTSRKEIIKFNKDLRRYRQRLRDRSSSKGHGFRKDGYQTILNHVQKYWGNLVLHPSLWRALQCQVVDRTNNLPESGHRNNKQSLRKATGRQRIGREFADYGPYLPVISNLKNAKYVERVLGEYKNLALEFAQLDPNEVEYYRERFQEAKHGAMFRAVRAVSQTDLL
jgi:hypothetical protein